MDKKIQIPAVHDKDLRLILDKYGLSNEIDSEKVTCYNCSKKITWDNLFAMKIVEDGIILFCDEPECIENSSN